MNRHASINRAFRLVWSAARGACIVAPETARGRGTAVSISAAGLCAALGSAAWAQSPPPTVVPVNGNTSAYTAPNGVPVVNLGTPNGAGLSHNQYQRYDVDRHGLVLNNSLLPGSRKSELAGAVTGNPNLGREATVILNEVVSANRSTLAGYTEVLGGRADVIVANPYGITCSGCGFLNTDRVTLTTGAPNFAADGSLAGFNVARGDVLINGSGLDASKQKILDIVTRSLRPDGQINTAADGSLGIVLGNNAWRYADREITGRTIPDGAAPAYAIDSTALGGMYAGRIRIIATEAGVGVRMLGDAAASVDDFRLDAAGRVQMQGRTSAARDLRITQGGDTGAAAIDINGAIASLSSGRDLALSSQGGVSLAEGMLRAGANLALQAQSLTDRSAGNASRSAGGALDAHIAGQAAIDGSVWGAGSTLSMQTGTLAVGDAGSRFFSGEDATAAARGMRIASAGDLSLARARLVSGADMALIAQGGALFAGAGVDAESAGNMALAARSALGNEGQLLAARQMNIDATDPGKLLALSNRGLLQSGATLAIGAAGAPVALTNQASGRVLADTLSFTGAGLDNAGLIQAGRGLALQLSGAAVNRAGGTLLGSAAGRDVDIDAASLDNAGTLQSAGALNVTVAGALGNAGVIETTSAADGGGDGRLALRAGSLGNSGTLAAAGAAGITVAGRLDNSGLLQARNLALTAGAAVDNQGAASRILAGGDLQINGNGLATVSNAGIIQAGGALRLGHAGGKLGGLSNAAGAELLGDTIGFAGRDIDNAGLVQGTAGLDVRAEGQLVNRAAARLVQLDAGNTLQLHAARIDNAGSMQSAGTLLARASGDIGNRGLVQAAGALDASAGAALANSGPDGRMLSTGGDLTLAAATLGNAGRLQAARNLSASAGGALGNSGVILNERSDGKLTLAGGQLDNSGTVQAAGALQLTTTGKLRNFSRIASDGTLAVAAATGLENSGAASRLLAAGAMQITGAVGFDVLNEGRIQSGAALSVASAGKLVNSAGAVLLGGSTALDAASIANRGSIGAQGNARLGAGTLENLGANAAIVAATGNVKVTGKLVNEGVIHGANALTVQAGAIVNRGTAGMSSQGDLKLGARSDGIRNDGALYAGKTLAMSAPGQTIVNGDNASIDAADIRLDAASVINSGAVEAKSGIAIKATDTFSNRAAGRIPGIDSITTTNPTTVVYDSGKQCAAGDPACVFGYTQTRVYEIVQTVTERLDAPLPVRKGRIIAGATLDIDYGRNGDNTAALLSAPAMTIHSSNTQPQAFVNQDLHLDQYRLAWRWKETYTLDDGFQRKESYSYSYPGSAADYAKANGDSFSRTSSNSGDAQDSAYRLESGRATIKTFDAGIYANRLDVQGGALINRGSPFTPDVNAISANPPGREAIVLQPGAGGAALDPATGLKITPVGPAATARAFQGLNLALPANPNGFFVLAKDPAARYLVETNPLFVNGAADGLPGADYLARQLGLDPDVLQKRLGDAFYEAWLVRDQIISQTGRQLLQGQVSEAAQLQTLMEQGALQSAPLGLTFGKALTPEQIARLEHDLVWMVEEDVGGTPVLVPVVYLARSTRQAVSNGPVIVAAEALRVKTAALENRGGTIQGGRIDIATTGDLQNLSGTIQGKRVALESSGGSVLNETYTDSVSAAVDNTVGRRAAIISDDALAITAKKDVAVKAATVLAGGDATLEAGESVAIYSAGKITTLAESGGVGSNAQMNRVASSVESRSETQIGAAVEAGGALSIKSGADLTVMASTLKSGQDMSLDAGRNLGVVSQQNTSEIITTGTISGAGIGGGLDGTSTTTTTDHASRNIASSVQSGGKLDAGADRTLLVRGSGIATEGAARLAADDVKIEAGENVSRTSSRTDTTTYFKLSSEGKTAAGANAKGAAASDSETSDKRSTEVDGREVASQTTTSRRSASTAGEIDTGKPLTADPARKAIDKDVSASTSLKESSATVDDRGNPVTRVVDSQSASSDRQNDDGKANKRTTSSASSREDSVVTKGTPGAGGGSASRELAAKGSASAQGSAGVSAEASGKAGVALVQSTMTATQEEAKKAVASTIASSGNLTIQGRKQVTLQGANLASANDIEIAGGKVDILAAQDSKTASTTSQTAAIGFLIDSKNKAEAAASGSASAEGSGKLASGASAGAARPDKVAAKVSGSASAKGEAKAAADSQSMIDVVRNEKTDTVSREVTNQGSVVQSSGTLTITADDRLRAQGAELRGDEQVALKARDMEFLAAQDIRESSTSTSKTAGGLYADGNAKAEAKGAADLKGEVDLSLGNHGALNQQSAHAGLSGSVAAKGSATADAKGGSGLQFRHETAQEQAASSTAKVTTIRSGAGDITRKADNRILDTGTAIDAAGDFSQQARILESQAAGNTESSSSRTQSDAGKLGVYGKANAEAAGNLQLSGNAGAGYTGNTLKSENKSKTKLDANAGAGIEAEYAHKDTEKSASSSTAVVSTIKAGGKLASISDQATTLEGTQMVGRNVEIEAGSLAIKAAGNTSQSAEQETEGKGKLNAGMNAGTGSPVTGGLSGSFDRTGKSSESADAVVGGITAGDSLVIRTRNDARLEGTRIEAGGDARLDVGGKLDVTAAKNTKSSSEEKIHGALELSATKSDSGSEKGLALEGAYAKKTDTASKSVVGDIAAGGNLALTTGGDARLEGTQLKARGDTAVDVKGNLAFDAARDTSRSESLSAEGSLNLGGASAKDTDKKEQTDSSSFGLKAAGKYEKTADDKALTGAINTGGDLRVRAGGDATLEGTELRAGNQASVSAGRDLNLKAATDTSASMKFSGELALGAGSTTASTLGKDGQATPDNKTDTRSAGLELSGDYARGESRRGGAVQAGAGGAQLSAGRDLALEGGSVKSGGDVALAAGGDLRLGAATSTASSIGGSLQAGRESARNTVTTDKDATENKLGASVRGGVNESNEGTAITSGGQVRLQSGGQTSMTNTTTKAARGAVTDAAKGVTTTTRKDRNDVLNLGASKKTESGGTPVTPVTPPAPAAAPARAAEPAVKKTPGPVIGGARKQAAKKKEVKPAPVQGRKPAATRATVKAAAPAP